MRFYPVAKRALDLAGSLVALILFSPLMFYLGWRVKRQDGGPVFFLGDRVGQYGKPFKIYKFRTMIVNAASLGPAVTGGHDPRITAFGEFLRRTKLDELPQLLNVLKGEMSLVGPRPEDPRYACYYTAEQRRVLEMKPGLTGLSSLAYRDEETRLAKLAATNPAMSIEDIYLQKIMPDKLSLELDYYHRRSLRLDLQILLGTVSALLIKR